MDEFVMPRSLSKGRTFVYMLPWREQDLLKVGYSRQPLVRLRTLHRRFFDVFDLERGQRSPAPLTVPDEAAGYSEWFRGVCPEVASELHAAAVREGLALHGLREWLRQWFGSRSDGLYDWSLRMLEAIEYEAFNVPPSLQQGAAASSLRYAMDLCEAVGLPLAGLFPDSVLAWRLQC